MGVSMKKVETNEDRDGERTCKKSGEVERGGEERVRRSDTYLSPLTENPCSVPVQNN